MAKTFLLIDYGEDICPPEWIDLVVLVGVAVNETGTEYWQIILSKLTWPCCFGDNVSERKGFA